MILRVSVQLVVLIAAAAAAVAESADESAENGALRLGDECNRVGECESWISASQCYLGYCACQPFFAQYNGTRCLASTLLGNECLVDEQCSLRVANSSCREGLCQCQDGHLQYRRHTCLGPAKLGQVCYSHEHCQLWDSDTHCDFLIPELFGRCQCTAPMRQDGEVCRPDRLVRPPPTAQQPATLQQQHYHLTADNSDDDATGVQLSWLRNATMLLSTVPPTQLMPMNLVTRRPSLQQRAELQPNELPGLRDDAIVVEAEITELSQTTELASSPVQKTDRHEEEQEEEESMIPALMGVSLGLECSWDEECQAADPHSRCMGGVCDCAMLRDAKANKANKTYKTTNKTNNCSAKRTGCLAGTFQCRSSGACISWFFVCDGKRDCLDGSDEQCVLGPARAECPAQAFRCYNSARCVSRAALCDGVSDCPAGEDEAGCTERTSCPEGAFRCNNGQCLPAYEFCNAVVSCRDASDEPRGACRTRNPTRTRKPGSRGHCPFKCANGRCRSDAITCSGRDGCGDNSDEIACNVCRCPPPALS